VDLGAVAGDTLAPVREAAERKGVAVGVALDADARGVHADPTALRQVLANLVENAVRHTSAGTVTVISRPDDGGVWVGVRDTGVGIPPEHLPRIFERFYRADASRARSSGGTGLGLSIVASLVDAHGGRIGVGEAPRGGAVFRVELPLAVDDGTGEEALPDLTSATAPARSP
jgi:signal transduction histidine kinase